MRKIVLVVLVSFFFMSCKKTDNGVATEPGFCDAVSSTYATDVQPLINTYCLMGSNCHNTGSVNNGGELTDYNKVFAKKVDIRRDVNLGIMPVNATLTTEEKKKIICWIDNGALNN